jgi:hypothetical protein
MTGRVLMLRMPALLAFSQYLDSPRQLRGQDVAILSRHLDRLDSRRLAKAVGQGMRPVENGSQQRVRTLKRPPQEGNERSAQKLHLP